MTFATFQFRRDTAANWTSANPVLLSGELGLETDTQKFKIGNGTSNWNSLPYGGIQGQTGATGAAGVSPTVTVGATTVVTPATNPSATDADAGPNADIRFSLPRARNVSAGTTTTGAAGTNASVASVQNGDGDVTLNFTIPRGDTGATGATGATGPAANSFTNIAVTGQNTVVADQANDTLTLVAGANIAITTNDTTDSVTISSTAVAQNCFAVVTGNTGTATADAPSDTLAITGGTGISTTATDTPDGLVITNTGVTSNVAGTGISVSSATGASTITNTGVTSVAAGTGISVSAATGGVTISNAGVTSVNGATGAVTVPTNPAVTRSAPTASASTVLTTVQSFPLAAGTTVAGHEYEFEASLRVINTTTATNLVVTLSVGAVNVLVLTQALGATAAAAPGAAILVRGRLTFASATAAEAVILAVKQAAVAFSAVTNTSAPVTVATAAATTIDLKVNTSGATSTFICRQATIKKVN